MNADHNPSETAVLTGLAAKLDANGRITRVVEGLSERYVRQARRAMGKEKTIRADILQAGEGAASGAASGAAVTTMKPVGLRGRLTLLAAPLLLALALALATALAIALAADPALAQNNGGGGGGGESINNAVTQVADFLSTLIVSLGGVALLIAVIVWLFSGSDERRRQGALRWIGSICVAIFVGLSVPTIVSFIQGVAGGGGG